MITGINLQDTIDYVIPEDKENPTVWKIGVVPSYIFAKMFSNGSTDDIESVFNLLKVSIKGWESFNVEFRTEKQKLFGREIDVVPIELLDRIPLNVITKLVNKVIELNRISEIERKN